MSTTKPILHVTGRLIGMKNAGPNGTLTGEGWAKYVNGNTTVYKNKLAYEVYDKKAQNNALSQFIEVVCFGNRYDWVSENIGKSTLVHMSGTMSFRPNVYNGNAYAGITLEVIDIDFLSNGNNTQGQGQTQPQQKAPQPAKAQGAPPSAQSECNSTDADDDMPF